ncbi:MAG: SPASM domain-containing protein, partial [Synergistaceae bacterium]|nr:SPASM domain-containing protein [Synergistaceae bacterium]
PCWSLLAKEESAIGFVDEEGKRFLYDLNASQWHNRTADKLKPCNTCPLIMICGGGCAGYDSKYLKEGNCDEAEKIFDDIAPHISGKSELKSLSMREALENLSPDERNTLLNTDDINKALGIYKKMKLKMTEK